MSFPNDDKRFLDLLQKWQDGDFTRGDEQELQALARGDDFRREALDGFLMHPEDDHDSRLKALRARLQPEKAVRRVIFPQMWAVAAALLLLVAALWFFRNPVPDTLDTIAQSEKPAVENRPLSDAELPAPLQPAPEGSAKSGATISASRTQQPLASGPAVARPDELSDATYEQKDVAAAPEAVVQPATSTAGEEEASKTDAEIAMNDVTVQKQKEEVEADDMKVAPKKAAADKTTRNLPGQQAPANSMQDVDFAMVALQDYLRRNARLPEAARQNNVSGFVQVSFRLNKRQKAVDFEVIRSLGYGCDEAAISLLKAYDWRDFSKDSMTVEVPFVR
ncbi:MAG: energy transducer TonB [Saprospiraceae bacterium]|nr:energy transducer TonB [Saprospiraceae bacterium]